MTYTWKDGRNYGSDDWVLCVSVQRNRPFWDNDETFYHGGKILKIFSLVEVAESSSLAGYREPHWVLARDVVRAVHAQGVYGAIELPVYTGEQKARIMIHVKSSYAENPKPRIEVGSGWSGFVWCDGKVVQG